MRLALLFVFLVAGCAGGGGDTGQTTAPSQGPSAPAAPTPARLMWASNGEIWTGQTDGNWAVPLVNDPGVTATFAGLTGQTVVYHAQTGQQPRDLWRIDLNGSNKLALAQTAHDDRFLDLVGDRAIYASNVHFVSVRLDGTDTNALDVTLGGGPYEGHLQDRLLYSQSGVLSHARNDWGEAGGMVVLVSHGVVGSVGDHVVYRILAGPTNADLYAAPLFNPLPLSHRVPLAVSNLDEHYAATVGQRVVYRSCAGVCNIFSVQGDGQGTVPLAQHPNDEQVQGTLGSRVFVRRVNGVDDELYSVPADGSGGEIPIATLRASLDRVVGFVGERIILQLGAELWSIHSSGQGLVQLTLGTARDEFAGAAGGFACFARWRGVQRDLWCVPSDGAVPAMTVAMTDADEAFLTGL